MRIAVDASALSGPGSGIARYLRALLARAVPGSPHAWELYGRTPAAGFEGACQLSDGLPTHSGRIVSLFTSQPRWAARRRPDLFWGPAHRLPWRLPRATARVVTVHDLCWLRAPRTMRASTRWLDRLLMPRALHQADRIIAVSHATRDALAAAFPALADRLVVVHEAAETLPAPAAPVIAGPYVLCVGTVEPRKNHARLFEAFARVDTPARLVLAGARGWGTDAPGAMARRAGIAERVTWLGEVDDATLASLYRHAALLAIPSLYEGFALPVLEALAHGTPVLHGDNSSMPEVAGDAGLGVDANSVDSIAAGLSRLLGDDALRADLAARARPQAARFSWERATRETLAVFEDALAARQARKA